MKELKKILRKFRWPDKQASYYFIRRSYLKISHTVKHYLVPCFCSPVLICRLLMIVCLSQATPWLAGFLLGFTYKWKQIMSYNNGYTLKHSAHLLWNTSEQPQPSEVCLNWQYHKEKLFGHTMILMATKTILEDLPIRSKLICITANSPARAVTGQLRALQLTIWWWLTH